MNQALLAQLLQQASAAMSRRAFGDVVATCQRVLAQFGEEANALMFLGAVQAESGDLAGAISFYERARAVNPSHVHVLTNLGTAYRAAGRLEDARAALEAALNVDRRFAPAQNNLGNVLSDIGDQAGAKLAYERAVALQANYVDPIAALARIAEEEHRLDDAKLLAERALRLSPQHGLARLTHGRVLLRQGDAEVAAGELGAVVRDPAVTVTNRIVAEGVFGEALDKLGRFDDAFAAFARANQLQYDLHGVRFAGDQSYVAPGTVAKLRAFVASTDVGTWRAAPEADPSPVFLVGFPRSGTTLLDQILASHPDVTTLEERDTLIDIADAFAGPGGALNGLAQLSNSEVERYRALYWGRVSAGLSGAAMRRVFVDKLPLNAVQLPFAYRLFPKAKVILALRDPRDCVLSCYQQRFGMNAAMYQLLRVDTAARYYDAVMSLVREARAKFPLAVHEVKYEAVVGDFDTAVQSLLGFLELPWDESVRGYAETAKRRSIATPSASQVVQPIYASAKGKWRNYRRFLEPVLPVLEPWVAAFGYEAS